MAAQVEPKSEFESYGSELGPCNYWKFVVVEVKPLLGVPPNPLSTIMRQRQKLDYPISFTYLLPGKTICKIPFTIPSNSVELIRSTAYHCLSFLVERP